MTNKPLCRLCLSLLLSALPLPAAAACLLLNCTCSATATPVAFGSYNPLSGPDVSNTGNVRVTCSAALGGTATYDIALDKGLYSAGFNPRQMGSGANRLNYNLYTTESPVTIWGDGTGGTGIIQDTVNVPILGIPVSTDYTVYGNIPAGQTSAAVGSYSDTITVTVTY